MIEKIEINKSLACKYGITKAFIIQEIYNKCTEELLNSKEKVDATSLLETRVPLSAVNINKKLPFLSVPNIGLAIRDLRKKKVLEESYIRKGNRTQVIGICCYETLLHFLHKY